MFGGIIKIENFRGKFTFGREYIICLHSPRISRCTEAPRASHLTRTSNLVRIQPPQAENPAGKLMENPKYYNRNVGANVCSDNAPIRSYLLVISRIYYPSCRGTKADVYAIFHLLVDFERNSFHFQKN